VDADLKTFLDYGVTVTLIVVYARVILPMQLRAYRSEMAADREQLADQHRELKADVAGVRAEVGAVRQAVERLAPCRPLSLYQPDPDPESAA